MDYKELITNDKWRYEGQCGCGGTPTYKYELIADKNIKLRIKPTKKKFNLYCRAWDEWNKDLSLLAQILFAHGLIEAPMQQA